MTKEDLLEIKTEWTKDLNTMKGLLEADLKGEFGDPDPEWRQSIEVKMGEVEDLLKELMKPGGKGMDIPQDAYNAIYGDNVEGWGQFAKDVAYWAKGKRPEKLVQYKTVSDEAEKAASGMQENVDSDGGFLVPTEQGGRLQRLTEVKAQLLPLIRNFPMSSNSLSLNFVKDSDRSGGSLGGVRMYYRAEAGDGTASKPELAEVTWKLVELFGLAYATNELIEDSPVTIGPWLEEEFSTATAWQIDYDIINGSGTGQPQGIMKAPGFVSVSEEEGQGAATIEAQNVINMYSRMPAMNRQNAVWLANEDTLPQLMTMVLVAGTAGVPVWMPANSLAGQPHDTLMGKQIIYTEHCQALGTAGDLIFWDPQSYHRGFKTNGMSMETSIHVKFITNETTFRFIQRHDARCPWPSPLTPRHSSATLAPIIYIESRTG